MREPGPKPCVRLSSSEGERLPSGEAWVHVISAVHTFLESLELQQPGAAPLQDRLELLQRLGAHLKESLEPCRTQAVLDRAAVPYLAARACRITVQRHLQTLNLQCELDAATLRHEQLSHRYEQFLDEFKAVSRAQAELAVSSSELEIADAQEKVLSSVQALNRARAELSAVKAALAAADERVRASSSPELDRLERVLERPRATETCLLANAEALDQENEQSARLETALPYKQF